MTVTRLNSASADLRALLAEQRANGRTIGFVPTMGYLHTGHQSLIEASAADGHFTVVSIFVNPAQFGPNEDLDTYPSNPEGDFARCAESGADLVWYPERADLYPASAQTMVTPGALGQRLCGISRPRFFPGICTVVLKLFNLIEPNAAYFGEKDFQQLTIIRRMAADFFLRTEVIGCTTVREADGLAKSSRNAYLAAEDRDLALTLVRTIRAARQAYSDGERDAVRLKAALSAAWPEGVDLDYLDFREPVNLELVEQLNADTRVFLGAWLKGIRLIDNAALGTTGTSV